ncbi:MAG: peptidylprolyl isomerase [Persicimonas sp.]
MKTLTRIFFVASICLGSGLLVTLAAPADSEAEIIDRIVARINDEIITYYELEESTTPYLIQQGVEPSALDDPKRREEIYREVLEEMVDQKLLEQEAAELDLDVSAEQVDEFIAQTRQRQGLSEDQFRQTIEQYGMSYDSYRQMIRNNLLQMRYAQVRIGQQVQVSEAEVREEYRKRAGEGDESDNTRIEVRHVLVEPEEDSEEAREEARKQAEAAYEALQEGEKFEEVAERYSTGPSADQGGHLGTFGRGELDEDFEKAAFALDEGELSEVVHTSIGFHVIEVTDIKEVSGDEEPSDQELQRLRAEMQEEAIQKRLDDHMEELREREFVEIKY